MHEAECIYVLLCWCEAPRLTSVSSLRATLMLLLDRKERDRRLHKEMSRTDCWKRQTEKTRGRLMCRSRTSSRHVTLRIPADRQESDFLLWLSSLLRFIPRNPLTCTWIDVTSHVYKCSSFTSMLQIIFVFIDTYQSSSPESELTTSNDL